MTDPLFLRRAEELWRRSGDLYTVTHTGFLTPAEQFALEGLPHLRDSLLLHGGGTDCERRAAFFLPEYLSSDDFDPGDYIAAIGLICRFGAPGHRDVLGSLLALGIERWTVGDIYTAGEAAWFFCLPVAAAHIQRELTHIGRNGVQVEAVSLDTVPVPTRARALLSFTVSSLRLDAILAGTFGLSRGQAVEQIEAGLVSLNYAVCQKSTVLLTPGDVFSLRGSGKATLAELGGHSKKGRLFVGVEKYV